MFLLFFTLLRVSSPPATPQLFTLRSFCWSIVVVVVCVVDVDYIVDVFYAIELVLLLGIIQT